MWCTTAHHHNSDQDVFVIDLLEIWKLADPSSSHQSCSKLTMQLICDALKRDQSASDLTADRRDLLAQTTPE